jgi:Helix-turn-helix domain
MATAAVQAVGPAAIWTGMVRMGRPMLPIDPASGTIQEFAAELRALREQAGNPPFRQLARRAHYSSTTLSVACSGTGLPSLEVTLALVRACDGSVDYWQQRWHDAKALTLEAEPVARPPRGRGAIEARPSRGDSGPVRRWAADAMSLTAPWGRRLAAAAVILAAAAAGATGWSVTHPPATRLVRDTSPRPAGPGPYIGVSPCDIGAVILSQAQLTLPSGLQVAGHRYPAGTVIGVVALRYSPRCALAWTRFLPARWLSSVPGARLTLQTRRPTDGATTTLSVSPIVGAEGDPLLTVPGCVLAQVTVRFDADRPAATASTGCYT